MKQINVKNIKMLNGYELPDYSNEIPKEFDVFYQNSIETGYFIFTMMPSLRCSMKCPHCYIPPEVRKNSPILSLKDLQMACEKVDSFYQLSSIEIKNIVFYWYGGEPTELGIDYILESLSVIDKIFTKDKGYYIKHEVLTSLVNVKAEWFEIFKTWGRGTFQTSYDGIMRGVSYAKKWEKQVQKAKEYGLNISTISVVNSELIKYGPRNLLDHLNEIGVKEASFLPFMLNQHNEGEKYNKYCPTMNEYSKFMIEITEYWMERQKKGLNNLILGQAYHIITRESLPPSANMAGQTLFLMPNGDFSLPDYRDGFYEEMIPFGNIITQSFEQILTSKSRRAYMRKQWNRFGNEECISCDKKNNCIMEFWKKNKDGDDCFGAKKYVDWLIDYNKKHKIIETGNSIMA